MTPLFLLSLPRSGSTLLQAHLSTSPAIASAPEPWVLLPFLTATDPAAAIATHNHQFAAAAIEAFAPEEAWNQAVRQAALHLYSSRANAASGEHYFLDKTPRYAVHARRIRRMFPEAKIVILWRDPRDIVASIVRTWGTGHWSVPLYLEDLHAGLRGLVDVADDSDVLELRYEDFVTDPTTTLKGVWTYLGLEAPEARTGMESLRSVVGLMGDRTGLERLGTRPRLVQEDAWAQEFRGRLRRRWLRRYLSGLPQRVHRLYPQLSDALPVGVRPAFADRPSDLLLVPASTAIGLVNAKTNGLVDFSVRSVRERFRSVL